MSVKGREFPGYVPRAMQGMALAYAMSNRGACHLRASPFATTELDGKADFVRSTRDERAAMLDSSGLCAFTAAAVSIEKTAAMLEGALPTSSTAERLHETGERIWSLERLFNIVAGLGRSDDTLLHRMSYVPAPGGTAKGMVARPGGMLDDDSELSGRDQEGAPRGQALHRLALS